MNKKNPIRCIGLVAREHGLTTLKELQSNNNYNIIVFVNLPYNISTKILYNCYIYT